MHGASVAGLNPLLKARGVAVFRGERKLSNSGLGEAGLEGQRAHLLPGKAGLGA
jgi:hypothetical protein